MARVMKDSRVEWIGEIPEGWGTNTAFQLFTQVKNKNEGLKEHNLLSLSYGKIKRKSIETVSGLLPESFDGYNIIEPDDIVLRLTDLQNDQISYLFFSLFPTTEYMTRILLLQEWLDFLRKQYEETEKRLFGEFMKRNDENE